MVGSGRSRGGPAVSRPHRRHIPVPTIRRGHPCPLPRHPPAHRVFGALRSRRFVLDVGADSSATRLRRHRRHLHEFCARSPMRMGSYRERQTTRVIACLTGEATATQVARGRRVMGHGASGTGMCHGRACEHGGSPARQAMPPWPGGPRRTGALALSRMLSTPRGAGGTFRSRCFNGSRAAPVRALQPCWSAARRKDKKGAADCAFRCRMRPKPRQRSRLNSDRPCMRVNTVCAVCRAVLSSWKRVIASA